MKDQGIKFPTQSMVLSTEQYNTLLVEAIIVLFNTKQSF